MSILFSLPVGRNTINALERSLNVIEYVEESIVILNCDKAIDLDILRKGLGDLNETRVFINPMPRSPNLDANLLESNCNNYIYAVSKGIKFTHVYFLTDTDMFFKKGLYDLVKNYHAGFLMCTSYLKPDNWKEVGFAEGTLWNQKSEVFWTEGLLLDKRIQRIYSDQLDGSFYCRELFDKILSYIKNLPIHYSKIEKSHYEEVTFGTVYLNLFIKEFPLFLPVSTIYRSDSILFRENDLLRMICREYESDSMIHPDSYKSFHMFTYGVKRVRYNEGWNLKVKQIIEIAKEKLKQYKIDIDI